MGCISGIVKTIMFIFNFLCLLVGLALLILGTFFYVTLGDYKSTLPGGATAIPILLIVVGVFIFFVSFLGCCGAIKNNKCMLLTYAVILIIILVIQLSVGIYGLVKVKQDYTEFKNSTNQELIKILRKYKLEPESKALMDGLQSSLKCCGVNDQSDYDQFNLTGRPGSCCDKPNNENCITNVDAIHSTGCGDEFFKIIDNFISTISIVAIVICAVELLGALFAIYLSRQN